MFLNSRLCCKKCFNPNETLYLEIRNKCVYYLYISIQYKIHAKLIKKQSSVFAPGKIQRVTFPSDASDIYFRIFDASQRPPGILCAKYIQPISSCYNVTGRSVGEILCLEVPCKTI